MKKTILLGVSVLASMMLFVACKTNVGNYQAAYEIAKQKDQGDLDDEIYQKIKAEEAPKVTVVGGDSIQTKIEPLSRLNIDGSRTPPSTRFNVVVGVYKIRVNADAHCKQLCDDGYKAFLMKNTESQFYVVAGAYDDIEPAAKFVGEFDKKHKGKYVGLQNALVVTPSHLMKRY